MLSPARCLEKLDALNLTQKQKDAFLFGNARRVFKL
jgi:predicted TIM-barrel fold metal-dependent hydrolase